MTDHRNWLFLPLFALATCMPLASRATLPPTHVVRAQAHSQNQRKSVRHAFGQVDTLKSYFKSKGLTARAAATASATAPILARNDAPDPPRELIGRGHRQPEADQLPKRIRRAEGHRNPRQTRFDRGLRICRSC